MFNPINPELMESTISKISLENMGNARVPMGVIAPIFGCGPQKVQVKVLFKSNQVAYHAAN